jgi:hypothetical protein
MNSALYYSFFQKTALVGTAKILLIISTQRGLSDSSKIGQAWNYSKL